MAVLPKIQPDVVRAFSLAELQTFRKQGRATYAVVGHNADCALISDIWFGTFQQQDDYKIVLEYIAACFETGVYRYWLSDLRYMSSSFDTSHDWLIGDLMPRVFASGLRRAAIVIPKQERGTPECYDVFLSATRVVHDLMDARVLGFHSVNAAKEWLFVDEA